MLCQIHTTAFLYCSHSLSVTSTACQLFPRGRPATFQSGKLPNQAAAPASLLPPPSTSPSQSSKRRFPRAPITSPRAQITHPSPYLYKPPLPAALSVPFPLLLLFFNLPTGGGSGVQNQRARGSWTAALHNAGSCAVPSLFGVARPGNF